MFRALPLAVWHDLSDVRFAEALDIRASFRRFCGFARTDPTPERTACVRFRKELIGHGLDAGLFAQIAAQLKARAVMVKTGTLVDATVVGLASEDDGEARWSGHRTRKAKGGTPRVVATGVWAKSEPAAQAETRRWLAEWNGEIHRVRCRFEKIVGTWKRSYGFRRMRWRGLAKALLQTRLTAIAYNLKRTLNILNPA